MCLPVGSLDAQDSKGSASQVMGAKSKDELVLSHLCSFIHCLGGFVFVFQFNGDVTDISHCVSFKCTA